VANLPDISRDISIIPIQRAAVVGAGTMGRGIAMTYANAGFPVLLKEINQEALDLGLTAIQKSYAAGVAKGKLSQEQMDQRLGLIQPTLEYGRFAAADIVVEAVFEGMALKKQVFAEVDRAARADAILASNTSTLDIDEIARATSRPQQVIGHHYFSPAHVMRLLEIVCGKQTSPSVIATSLALAERLGKVGVLVGNCRGFVGNRMYGPYQRESQFLLEEGARVEEVDAALVKFGMAMGPFAVGDLAGLDVSWRIRKEYRHMVPAGQRVPLAADRLCELGRFGQKTGAGWYRYPPGSRTPAADPEVQSLIEECSRRAGIKRRSIPAEEIVERTIWAVVNEGARILEEGYARSAEDIDIIWVNGYGFPAQRGGPMAYADTVGLGRVCERIGAFERQHGTLWAPAELLQRLAAAGKTFAEHDRSK
jgi:3-hydroxyacyl-CoA dehydrogenase